MAKGLPTEWLFCGFRSWRPGILRCSFLSKDSLRWSFCLLTPVLVQHLSLRLPRNDTQEREPSDAGPLTQPVGGVLHAAAGAALPCVSGAEGDLGYWTPGCTAVSFSVGRLCTSVPSCCAVLPSH